eukprot:TRINITY_DN1904_c0_g1_i8.p2 TRINITY_DN1904_c0_g1~~TRINITY_DN1904_c0_g1_i8.p2  ORF type:complete len:112 (+),score=24.77 TRINITY_DN1904_c0_g1_i8:121-456(+)
MANTEAAEFLRERMRAEQRAYLNHTGTVRRLNPITGRTEVIVYDVPKEPTPEPVLSRPESKRTFSKQEISQYVASADPKHLISLHLNGNIFPAANVLHPPKMTTTIRKEHG